MTRSPEGNSAPSLSQQAGGLGEDQLGSFRRAFAKPGAHIVIDGWSPRWAREDTAQALALGLLTAEEDGDEQYTCIRYRPTDAFRAALQQAEAE